MADTYPYTKEVVNRYSFISIGHGKIKKVVTLDEIAPHFYNVLLQDEVNGLLSDDITITDNGDALKVVNTVALIIKEFIDSTPACIIHIAGSDRRRNRMYQRRIKRELMSEEYTMLGATEIGGDFVPLLDSVEYVAFLAFHK